MATDTEQLMRKTGLAALAVMMLASAGCQSGRFGSVNTASAPPPLAPAPSGTVTSSALPPPSAPATASATQFPAAPTTDVAAVSATPAAPPPNAPDITAGSVSGVWTASVSGQSCKIAMAQTKLGQSYRAAPLGCPAPVGGVKSWNIQGKQLVLFDEGGATLARLYSSGPQRFDGQIDGGPAISLALQ
jgi:hypothetical protein